MCSKVSIIMLLENVKGNLGLLYLLYLCDSYSKLTNVHITRLHIIACDYFFLGVMPCKIKVKFSSTTF